MEQSDSTDIRLNRRKVFGALAVLGAFIGCAYLFGTFKPHPQMRPPEQMAVLKVDSQIIQPVDYQITLSSFGNVRPRTQSLLVSQVSGQIVNVNPAFRDGGFFDKDDILVEIDDRDYQYAVSAAEADLLQAKLALVEEKAQSNQAARDWERLGDGETAPELVLRKPQLAAAEAEVMSAASSLEKARLDLSRTKIRAPFSGRVLSTSADLGQYIGSNSEIGEIFATDVVEIRLPLKNSELELIDLPEYFRGEDVRIANFPSVTLTSRLGKAETWPGSIVRAEAALDDDSHQLYVVAQIEDPFNRENHDQTPLKIGQYVTANIDGRLIPNALVVPTSSIYQGSFVYVVTDGVLQRREIDILYQSAEETVVANGLEAGSEIVTTPLGQVASGTPVQTSSAQTANADSRPPFQPEKRNL